MYPPTWQFDLPDSTTACRQRRGYHCDSDPLAENGRGLLIVRRLSPNVVGTIYPGYGKTISAALPVCQR